MESPTYLSFSEGFDYLYLKEKCNPKCYYQHNINVTENTTITDNSFHPNIQLTWKVEEENQLAFLGVFLIWNGNFNETKVYQKPANNSIDLNWKSFAPNTWMCSTLRTLLKHGWIKISGICFWEV